jgi:hypothetical protein
MDAVSRRLHLYYHLFTIARMILTYTENKVNHAQLMIIVYST